MVSILGYFNLTAAKGSSQTDWIHSQPQTTWTSSSSPFKHCSQILLSTTFLLWSPTFVGKAFEHACQRKTLILLGNFIRQMCFQKSFAPLSIDLDGTQLASASHSNWYPNFTEYSPVLHFGHYTQSSWLVTQMGVPLIRWASKGRNMESTNWAFQPAPSEFNNLLTVHSVEMVFEGEITLVGSSPGSHLSSKISICFPSPTLHNKPDWTRFFAFTMLC